MGRPGIFVLKNTSTGKQYVGQSNDVDGQRKKQDSLMRNGRHYNSYIQQDYNRGQRFSFSILEYCNQSQLNQRKNYWIRQLNTFNNGYNQTGRQRRNSVNFNQQNTQQISWPEIWSTRSEVELNNYNRRIKRLDKWTKPYVVLILLILIFFFPPSILLIFLIYFHQYIWLYSAKKDYNSAIRNITDDYSDKKIGSVTITFIKITLKNIFFIEYIKKLFNTNPTLVAVKEDSSNKIKNKQSNLNEKINNKFKETFSHVDNEINKNTESANDLKTKYENKVKNFKENTVNKSENKNKNQNSTLKMKYCPQCGHRLNQVAKKMSLLRTCF